MAGNQICSFCTKKGIIGPHDHTIRNWSSKEKEIICPQLLANHCTYCGELGHTKNYCEKLKAKNARINAPESANPNKDEITGNKRERTNKFNSNKKICK